jgi:hypothetical protein
MLRAGREDEGVGSGADERPAGGGSRAARDAGNAAPASADGHYIFFRSRQYGPATLGEIKSWRLDARIDDSAYIWCGATLAWIPLRDFAPWKELALGPSASTPARPLAPAEGTTLHPRGYANPSERRHAFRLAETLVMEFCVLARDTNRPASLMGSLKIDNISGHGVGFTIYRTEIVPGDHLFMKIHIDDAEAIETIGEVVRVSQRQHVGVGFRKIKGKAGLDAFLKRRR